MASRKVCYQYANNGICRFKNCQYDPCASRSRNNGGKGATKRKTHRFAVKNNSRLDFWTKKAFEGKYRPPLGQELGPFFEQGRSLIEASDGTLQEVIQCLSSSGGLKRIQELVERDYSEISDISKRELFESQTLPFIKLVTHRNVLASLVVEQNVVAIYNCIWGPMGRRGEPFLHFLADIVQHKVENYTKSAASYLEILDPEGQLENSRAHLERLQRRLDIGKSLPTLFRSSKLASANQSPATFTITRAPPGGRHDNDHADICQIQIMPTYQEILSSQSEYLPLKDPAQWHIGGLAGLLDRNSRLLREDTVGQLRDVIHAELRSGSKGSQKSPLRGNVYKQVKLEGLKFDRFAGLQFRVQFAQPSNVQAIKKDCKKEWWELSKRLQPSALVCLIDSRGFAIFCTVADNLKCSKVKNNYEPNVRLKSTASLWENAKTASVNLELVEQTGTNWQYILDCHSAVKNGPSISLMEFTGILLPSFQPTLLALQKMQKAADLPMSEFLVPLGAGSSGGVVDVAPPAYATAASFSFDLHVPAPSLDPFLL
ncbi:uncharacterized protein CDV56_100864 [Aspergillus thermomutatus]|uniref:ZNFX1 domain-containing protein n=1 Tax=Aspergillus thermomutatus TaxID=41047 RepID=A0A397FWY1_ASPTH|nr:uncharacterized protein CDV56_100864 [Aspergillus thermomutatus]RHZ43107.1 hypothetical protein CDV56_100864 [Aspergillus thermomutatus]